MKLEHIDYRITKVCDLRCVHCSAEAGEGEAPDVENIKRVLQEAKPLGLKRIGISGGEPFLFPKELSDLIDFSSELDCPVHIHTNGQPVEQNLNLIRDKAGKIEYLTLTLMGYKSTHDSNVRKIGAYENLRNVAGKIAKISPLIIMFIPMSNNYDDLLLAIDDFSKLGMKKFRPMRLAPGGRARENYAKLQLTDQSEDFSNYLEFLREVLNLELEAGYCTRLIHPRLKALKNHQSCTSGINRLHINDDGNVFPCTAASGLYELSIGNINDQSLRDIWENSPTLIELRSKHPPEGCHVQEFYDNN